MSFYTANLIQAHVHVQLDNSCRHIACGALAFPFWIITADGRVEAHGGFSTEACAGANDLESFQGSAGGGLCHFRHLILFSHYSPGSRIHFRWPA